MPDTTNANDRTAAKARSTLTVVVKTRETRIVDLDPQGPSHGDMRALNALLHNASGTKRIGRLDGLCVLTDTAEKAHKAECTFTDTLPGREISVQTASDFPKFSEHPPPTDVAAITGGTGEYAGVRGELRIETRGSKVIHTFHFVG